MEARPARSAAFGAAATASFAYSILVLLLLHVIRPEYSPATHYISEYAVGRLGWIMATCFLGLGVGSFFLALGVRSIGLTSRVGRAGIAILAILSFSSLIAAAFPMDTGGGPPTLGGRIHALNFYVSISSVLLVQVLLSIGFGRDPRWRSFQRTSVIWTGLLVVAYGVQFFAITRGAYEGIANRFFGVVWFGWLLATSLQVRRLARSTSEPVV